MKKPRASAVVRRTDMNLKSFGVQRCGWIGRCVLGHAEHVRTCICSELNDAISMLYFFLFSAFLRFYDRYAFRICFPNCLSQKNELVLCDAGVRSANWVGVESVH